jgi:hypothetical protein
VSQRSQLRHQRTAHHLHRPAAPDGRTPRRRAVCATNVSTGSTPFASASPTMSSPSARTSRR